MKTGALLFAFDGDIKYTNLAVACAKQIKQHLGIPVTLITDQVKTFPNFDNQLLVESKPSTNSRYWHDTDKSTSWLNHSRSRSLELTPYDRTLVVDVDYIVNTDRLKILLESEAPLFAHKQVFSVDQQKSRCEKFGTKNADMWWATVLVFDRSEFVQDVFAIWQMVEKNYRHYANFFGFNSLQFRNDYALSIALLVANGGIVPEHCNIPWALFNVDTDVAFTNNSIVYQTLENSKKKYKTIDIVDQDLHIMGKSYLEGAYAAC